MLDKKEFQEKELDILREAVDNVEKQEGRRVINSPEVKQIIEIVEKFIKKKHLVCYGGTAINNILPVGDQFYDKTIELPDYDFFSPSALKDAKELADIYASKGYDEVEAKAGIHKGTFKVYVNFIPVADITDLNREIYTIIKREAIVVKGIRYTPPNYLRMSMYLELSRPIGDVGRWEKVLKRLILLNKNFPIKNIRCEKLNFMRDFEGNKDKQDKIYTTVKDSLINQGLIFFGGYANSLYGRYMPKEQRKQIKDIPDFDVLSEDAEGSAVIVKEQLHKHGIKNITIKKRDAIGENIPLHYEIIIDEDTVCFIYEPIACHSFNTIKINGKSVNIATIDTMLSFYLAFLFTNQPYYDHDRILCMSQYLFSVQSRNRLEQKGLLKRFTINCYGKQKTLEDFRAAKNNKYKELKNNRGSPEYEEYFLSYNPHEHNKKKNTLSKSIHKSKKRHTQNRNNIKKLGKKLRKKHTKKKYKKKYKYWMT
jgi:hypothetical protein